MLVAVNNVQRKYLSCVEVRFLERRTWLVLKGGIFWSHGLAWAQDAKNYKRAHEDKDFTPAFVTFNIVTFIGIFLERSFGLVSIHN